MTELRPCPICGRIPKIKKKYPMVRNNYSTGYHESYAYVICIIECKALFGKPHIRIEESGGDFEKVQRRAIDRWNVRVAEKSPHYPIDITKMDCCDFCFDEKMKCKRKTVNYAQYQYKLSHKTLRICREHLFEIYEGLIAHYEKEGEDSCF